MRLRHSNASGHGYRRVRAGAGFSYKDLDGSTLPPGPVRDRLESIGIPPAWTDVWIAPFENGHIQATGLDAVGRRQYIYHPEWRERKDRLKFDRALQLAESLPTARRLVTLDLRSDGVTRERVWLRPSGCWTAAPCVWGQSGTRTKTAVTGSLPCSAPMFVCGRNACTSVFRRRAAKPGSPASMTLTWHLWPRPSSGAAATRGCWPTRTAARGTR
jgi:hypothetical protein